MHVALNPVLISEYSDEIELIVVEISIEQYKIRVITGYGPQEVWNLDVKMKFFLALEEEVAKATIEGRSVIIMGDMNSKLGPNYIKKDPKTMTGNGSILAGIIERNVLTVVNGLEEKCTGLITRQRTTTIGDKKVL